MTRNFKLMLGWLAVSFIWVFDIYLGTKSHSTFLKVLSVVMMGFSVARAYHYYRLEDPPKDNE